MGFQHIFHIAGKHQKMNHTNILLICWKTGNLFFFSSISPHHKRKIFLQSNEFQFLLHKWRENYLLCVSVWKLNSKIFIVKNVQWFPNCWKWEKFEFFFNFLTVVAVVGKTRREKKKFLKCQLQENYNTITAGAADYNSLEKFSHYPLLNPQLCWKVFTFSLFLRGFFIRTQRPWLPEWD